MAYVRSIIDVNIKVRKSGLDTLDVKKTFDEYSSSNKFKKHGNCQTGQEKLPRYLPSHWCAF